MTKHTPGPWFVFGNKCCVGGPHADNETAGIAMCSMRLRADEEIEANARLIAASPTLLAACQGMAKAARTILANDDPDSVQGLAAQALLDAIALAEGT